MSNTLSILIPFPGFYGTQLEEMPDDNLRRVLEDVDLETAREIWDLIYDTKNYGAAFQDLAKLYLENFQIVFNEATGLGIEFTFDEMTSPREYNFETDRLFANISYADAKKLYRFADKEKLKATIYERCSSRSGFISSYSNDINVWQQKPILRWDHNELGILLESVCMQLDDDIENSVYDLLQDDYNNGNGPNIDDSVYTAASADKEKVNRLETLLAAEFDKVRNYG